MLPGVLKCTRVSCLMEPACRLGGDSVDFQAHKCVNNLLHRSITLTCQRQEKWIFNPVNCVALQHRSHYNMDEIWNLLKDIMENKS